MTSRAAHSTSTAPSEPKLPRLSPAGKNIAFYSIANGELVFNDLGPDVLRAGMMPPQNSWVPPRTEAIFRLIPRSDGSYALRASNMLYVSAELGWTPDYEYWTLRARATAIGPWEQFRITTLSSGIFALQAANGRYVEALLDHWPYAYLAAQMTTISDWTLFRFRSLPGG